MNTRELEVETADGVLRAFAALPDGGGRHPAVLVAQEAFGVNHYIRQVCERFASEGFVAVAPELFHRAGDGIVVGYDELAKAMPMLARIDDRMLETDLRATLAAMRLRTEVDPARVGVVGFCMGGYAAFLAACRTDVASAVSFYGGGVAVARPGSKRATLLGEVPAIHAPLLLLFGGKDTSIPAEQIESTRAALQAAGKVHEVVVYPEAQHGFHCDARATYDAESAADAWTRALHWLRRTMPREAPAE